MDKLIEAGKLIKDNCELKCGACEDCPFLRHKSWCVLTGDDVEYSLTENKLLPFNWEVDLGEKVYN
jgi:hypothetical protein